MIESKTLDVTISPKSAIKRNILVMANKIFFKVFIDSKISKRKVKTVARKPIKNVVMVKIRNIGKLIGISGFMLSCEKATSNPKAIKDNPYMIEEFHVWYFRFFA